MNEGSYKYCFISLNHVYVWQLIEHMFSSLRQMASLLFGIFVFQLMKNIQTCKSNRKKCFLPAGWINYYISDPKKGVIGLPLVILVHIKKKMFGNSYVQGTILLWQKNQFSLSSEFDNVRLFFHGLAILNFIVIPYWVRSSFSYLKRQMSIYYFTKENLKISK